MILCKQTIYYRDKCDMCIGSLDNPILFLTFFPIKFDLAIRKIAILLFIDECKVS